MNLSIFFTQNRNSHRFVALLSAAILCPTLFFVQSQIHISLFLPNNTQNKVFSAQFFKFSTIGYWPAAVDSMWIETLQMSGEKKYPPELIPSTSAFYEMATDLDPKFYELYEQAGVFFSFFFHSTNDSIHFLEKGIRFYENLPLTEKKIKSWSHPYTLNLLLAYQYSFEKNDWGKSKEYYLKAADIPGAPRYLQNMRVWLEEKGSEKELAKRVLSLLIRSTDDPMLKAQYEEKARAYD